jgi:nucleoid-associated protein YgaU
MTKTKIGLKLANGEFYAVLADGSVARKRLVVTTVQDGQRSVQIDLYRGEGPTVSTAAYIGSLVIENIPFAPRGEPDIRLDLTLEADGTLSAYAEDAASGEHQSLQVSLESLSEEQKYEIPDFAFEVADEATDSLPEAKADTGAYSGEELASTLEEEKQEAAKPKSGIGKIVLFALLALIIALGLAYLVYHFGIEGRGAVVASQKSTEVVAPAATAAPAANAAPAAAAATPAAPAPAAPQPAAAPIAATPAPPTPAPAAPAEAKKTGVWHKVRWGDTLWDLSYAYYQNPWLFAKIARANNIKNPDLIISGTRIWIPSR